MKFCVSVIGLRAYPSDFVGTSGLEVYAANVIDRINSLGVIGGFRIYVKSLYQQKRKGVGSNTVRIICLPTLRSRVFESVVYAFLASLLSAFDKSKIIWYHGVGPGIFAFIPRLFGKRVFITVHSPDWRRKKWTWLERVLFKSAVGFALRFTSEVFSVSPLLAREMYSEFGRSSVVVHPGINVLNTVNSKAGSKTLARLGIRSNSYILYLGRIVPEKRLEWLIDALYFVRKKYPHYKLVIAGGHGNMPRYEAELLGKKAVTGIVRVGYVFGNEKSELLANSGVFVLPSELEGTSISFMEALGVGVHCVIAREYVGPFKSLPNVFGFNDSFLEFKKALLVAVSKKRLTGKSYTLSQQKLLSQYTWERLAKTYVDKFVASGAIPLDS